VHSSHTFTPQQLSHGGCHCCAPAVPRYTPQRFIGGFPEFIVKYLGMLMASSWEINSWLSMWDG
jgi:hypothetical protein